METEVLTTELGRITEAFADRFGHLGPEELNWKPDAKTWSVAQNADHLIVTNESYYPVIESLRAGTYRLPFIARFGFLTNFFGKTILQAVDPSRKRKVKTFSIFEPSSSEIDGEIIERFCRHQEELAEWMAGCEDLVEAGTVIASPASRKIVYKLEAAFRVIVTHEWRHFEQAKEVDDLRLSSI